MNRRFVIVVVILAVGLSASCRRGSSAGDSTASASGGAAESGSVDVPSTDELEAFVTGAGAVHLGMTEDEVSAALGANPTRRQDATSRDAPTDVAWDRISGARPGAATGRFFDGRLVRIEFAPAAPELPRLGRAVAESLTRPEYARRAADRTLRMADIESVTSAPGYRANWAIGRGVGGKTTLMSRWLWEIESSGKVLVVEEEDGLVRQPVIRSMR
jgi:hypothetical protein